MLDLGNVDEANRKVLDNERIKQLIHVLMKVYKKILLLALRLQLEDDQYI